MDRVSLIIPGRCEKYFQQTIDSALERATGDVEVVAIVDGEQPPTGPVEVTDDRVKLIVLEKSIGQRAGYNLGVRESTGEFVMKIDAHALSAEEVEAAFDCVFSLDERKDGSYQMFAQTPSGRRI